MSTLVEQLSTYAATLPFENLPREVVHTTRRLIVDTVGCALGGYSSEPARIARDLAATLRSASARQARAAFEVLNPGGVMRHGNLCRVLALAGIKVE